MDSHRQAQLHVVMLPWLAHGHISPYLELSTRLAQNGIQISFVSTPHNIAKLKPLFTTQNNTTPGKENLRLVEIPLPPVEGLLPGIENTTDMPPDQMGLLVTATDNLKQPFESLLRELSPDFVVYDVLQAGAARAALKLGIPAIFFIAYGAAYYSYDYSPARGQTHEITAENLARPPPGYPSSAVSWRLSEASARLSIYNYKIGESTMRDRIMSCYEGCCAIAIKSCDELEAKYIQYLEEITEKKVFPVGPLVANKNQQLALTKNLTVKDNSYRCLRWLDSQAPSSVVFVSFGTEFFLSKEQIEEVTLGLEASQQPFICVLRFPCTSEEDFRGHHQSRLSSLLPDGFEGRIGERGLVVSWAPQREILSHSCTGSFVTHCGWSSILEGLSNGLPLIALPMQLDQALNARLIVDEFQVGVEVERLNREEISKAVRRIMVEEGGGQVRSEALQMAELFRSKISNGVQDKCMHHFINYLNGFKFV